MFIFARPCSVKLFPIIDLLGICSMHTLIERSRVDRLVVKVVELLRQVINTVLIFRRIKLYAKPLFMIMISKDGGGKLIDFFSMFFPLF